MNIISESKRFQEFYPTIRRLFFLVLAWYYQFYCLISTSTSEPKSKTRIQLQQEYSDKYLSRFLSFASSESSDWNANVEAVFHDKEALDELLKDPKNTLEQQWRHRILIENTPRGNVIMFYDIYKRGFSYYCDQAVMPYDVMNAVAMKYIMTFRCLAFFVDSSVLSKLSSNPEVKTEKVAELPTIKNKEDPSNSAFAKFKTYNASAKRAEVSKEAEKVINCFLHLGPVRNWSVIEKTKRVNPINGFKTDVISSGAKLSYQDYKRMKSQK